MAIFYAQIKPLSRGDGRSSVAAAAYRAGERLEDARTGLVHDYSRRSGVSMAELLTPEGSVDRSALWNAAEAAEKRKDSRTAREWVLALPSELDAPAREELARSFAAELVRRYGVAVDMAIHEPGKEGDERNHHAHLLATTRRMERDGSGAPVMGEKTPLELSDTKRRAMGLGPAAAEVTELRQVWEGLANAALERAGRSERIDSRSLEAQGLDREPTRHLGPSATAMERRRQGSHLGDENREVQRRNAERERLAAEIIDLQAERERRAQEERAELEREAEAARAAEMAQKAAQAAAEALQERERRQREAEARKAQEEAQRAAETERKTARLLSMTAQELAAEIARHRPEAPEKLALQSPETAEARERARFLVEERRAAEARRQQAEAEISAYRKRYRLRSALHDRGLMKSRVLTKSAQSLAEAQREEARLEPLASAALGEFATLRDQASTRIAKEQEPLLKLVAGMEQLQAHKAQEEAQAAAREAHARKEAEERLAAKRATQAAKEAQAAAREAHARKEAEERLAAERAAQAAKEREEAQKRAEQEEREFWKLAKANPEAALIEAIKKVHLEGAEGDTARRRWRELNAPEREREAPRPKTSSKEPPAPDQGEAQRAERQRQEDAERIRQWHEKRARDRARGRDRDR